MATNPIIAQAERNTEIQSLATHLASCIPPWVRTSELDAEPFHLPSVPAGFGGKLREAAKAHRDAMLPANHQQRMDILRGLRLSTVARNESPEEARASFAKLVDDLKDVPEDILRDACRAYTNEPGTRFFPRGAGEIRAFTNPLMIKRSARAWRLNKLADASDEVFDESTRCTPEQARAILEELGIQSEMLEQVKRNLGPPRKPTAADYAEIMGTDQSTKAGE